LLSFRLTLVHFNMCTVCSSGDVSCHVIWIMSRVPQMRQLWRAHDSPPAWTSPQRPKVTHLRFPFPDEATFYVPYVNGCVNRHNCRIWGTRAMIQKKWQEIKFRLDISRATNGAHIEMY
jgi:hypothetical protein